MNDVITLAEALAQRADFQRRLQQVQARMTQCVTYVEGEDVMDDAHDLLVQCRALVDSIEGLVRRINRTNSATVVDGTATISDFIARRDATKLKLNVVQAALTAGKVSRYSRSKDDLKDCSQFNKDDFAALRREADELSAVIRKVDGAIQKANFTTDLLA